MSENRKQSEPKDYKERFEFILKTNGNIICQRFFKINRFEEESMKSYEIVRALRKCANIIDKDLKDKTHVYLSMQAPRVFESKEQMNEFFSNPENKQLMSVGDGVVVKGSVLSDYCWDGEKAIDIGRKFDDGELSEWSYEENKSVYILEFRVDGRVRAAIQWESAYPKFVRDRIDLTNRRGRFISEDKSRLSYEQYLLYRMFNGKEDLTYPIIRTLTFACSENRGSYTTKTPDIMKAWNDDRMKVAMNMI